jgi:hypothetical protein
MVKEPSTKDKTPTVTLPKLAKEINHEHEQFDRTIRAGLAHARRAGELLIEAKAQIPHGGWLNWLRDNCPQVSPRTAQQYMQVHSRWGELAGKCETVAHLTFREALQLLAEPRQENAEDASTYTIFVDSDGVQHKRYKCFADAPAGHWAETCRLWWDLQAIRTFLLNVAWGWDADRIAEFLGADVREVRLILHPTPPERFTNPAGGSELVATFADSDAFVRAYREQVAGHMHGILWALLLDISADDERFAAAAEELAGRAPQHKEIADRQRYALDRLDFLSPEEFITAAVCALTDARAALGIEPPWADFAAMWDEYHALPVPPWNRAV